MNCQEILTILELYRAQAVKVLGLDVKDIEVSSAYSFIKIDAPNLHIQFEVNNTSSKIYELHPEDQSVKSKIESVKWPGFESTSGKNPFPQEINKHLTAAESIAKVAVNCTNGDDYRPGNFSKIIYTGTLIELQQINHMNSRSSDHKKDYSLRSLVFRIDLKNPKELSIDFNDNSSANNKHCGDEIQTAINAYQSEAK
jgi:hypothetical protein